jgi:predicted kinase
LTDFIVVRGPALTGKTAVARGLAERLPGKVAVLSQDDLAERWIVGHDSDFAAETELVYRQLRLLSAAYIRSGYHVIVDAAFAVYRDGAAATHESDLRELLALVSTIPNVRPLLVGVTASLEALRARAAASDRWDARAVEALHRAFEQHAFRSALEIDTSALSPGEAAERIIEHRGGVR